jgi:hypothetical protein
MLNIIFGALKSKTIWVSIATILVGALVTPVQDYVAAHPGIASTIIGLVFGLLRTVTGSSLAAKGTPSA